jgi:ABC-2 type transport system permease protein
MRTLRFLLRKEFLQLFRDRTIMGMIFVMPIVQLLVLANAITFEVKSARLYLVDHDHSTMSRGLVDRMAASGRFVPTAASGSTARADEAMRKREVDLILVIPPDFERALVRERRAPVQLVFNAEDGAAAGVTRAYASEIIARYAAELGARIDPSLPAPDAAPAPIDLRQRGWYNSTRDYRHYMVPGILVVLVTVIGTLLTAMNIVREKEAGTLDQLNVTPVSRTAFMAAKLIPLWTFALIDLALGLAFAHYALGVPVRGSLALIFFAAAIYLLVALGIGLWISTTVETQQQAMFVTYSLLMIYLLMSGLFTPVRGMPGWAQWATEFNPVMHFTRLMRAVLLKGAGFADVARQLVILALSAVVVLSLAVRRYRKTSA